MCRQLGWDSGRGIYSKYHDFFDADGQIVLADIGHYESEQYTVEIIAAELKKKFVTFATRFSTVNTNPINYF